MYILTILPLYFNDTLEILDSKIVSIIYNINSSNKHRKNLNRYSFCNTLDNYINKLIPDEIISVHLKNILFIFFALQLEISEEVQIVNIGKYMFKIPKNINSKLFTTILLLESDILINTKDDFEFFNLLNNTKFFNLKTCYDTPILSMLPEYNPYIYIKFKKMLDKEYNDAIINSLSQIYIAKWILCYKKTISYFPIIDITFNYPSSPIYTNDFSGRTVHLIHPHENQIIINERKCYYSFNSDQDFNFICASSFLNETRIISFKSFEVYLVKSFPLKYTCITLKVFEINFPNAKIILLNPRGLPDLDSDLKIYSTDILDNYKQFPFIDETRNYSLADFS